jgi:hypothetical protein
MSPRHLTVQSRTLQSRAATTERIALDEYELAARWGLSVKTLRRWRQHQLGPVFCKLGARVTYLITEIEAFEQRQARYSTSARAGADESVDGGEV